MNTLYLDTEIYSDVPLSNGTHRYAEQSVPFTKDRDALLATLEEFFRGRLRAFYRERFPGDVVDACLEAVPAGALISAEARAHPASAFALRVPLVRHEAARHPGGDAGQCRCTGAHRRAGADRKSVV
mgnify:CR=1 FL=1